MGFLLIIFLPLAANIPGSIHASEDPVTTFIIKADSLAQAGGDDLLVPYLLEDSILGGAAVGQLLDVALELGDGGDKDILCNTHETQVETHRVT